MKKIDKYFKEHYMYNASTHLILGLGLGVLMTYPLVGPHPLRWGVALAIIGLLGHLYPVLVKK